MDTEQQFYWHIIKWDGEVIPVKPENAPRVQQMLDQGEGFIKTKTRSINIKDIKDFVVSDQPFGGPPALPSGLEDKPKEPVYFERDNGKGGTETVIEATWVRKNVPRRKWESYYRFNSAYRKIQEDDNYVVIAFRIATCDVNEDFVSPMTDWEVAQHHLEQITATE